MTDPREYDGGPFEWCPDCDEEYHHSEVVDRECPKCGGRLE